MINNLCFKEMIWEEKRDIKTYFTKKSNSTVKFKWDFDKEMEKALTLVSDEIVKELVQSQKIESIEQWNNNLKIKVNDEERMIYKHINCIFRYDKDDRWFWKVHIEFAISEKWKKSWLHYVGEFSLADKKGIVEKILKDLVIKIEEIK